MRFSLNSQGFASQSSHILFLILLRFIHSEASNSGQTLNVMLIEPIKEFKIVLQSSVAYEIKFQYFIILWSLDLPFN